MRDAQRIGSLTGLRFIAAMLVVVYHFGQRRVPGVLGNVVSSGYTGVSLFFVLSGFVLAYTYGRKSHFTGYVERRPFFIARFARVYPLYALSLLVALPYFLTQEASLPGLTPVLVVLLLQAWFPVTAAAWNGPAWSLSAEAFFYLIFPVALPTVAKMARRYFWPAMAVTFTLSMVAPVLYMLVQPDGVSHTNSFSRLWFLDLLKYNPLLRLAEFIMGTLCGMRLLGQEVQSGDRRRGTILVIFAASVILLMLAISPRLPFPLLHNGLLAPLYCLLIYALVLSDHVFAPVLGSRPLLLLGEASYGIYLLHVPLQNWLRLGWERLGFQPGSGPYALVYGVIVIILPTMVFLAFERPARRMIRSLLEGDLESLSIRDARVRAALALRRRASIAAGTRDSGGSMSGRDPTLPIDPV